MFSSACERRRACQSQGPEPRTQGSEARAQHPEPCDRNAFCPACSSPALAARLFALRASLRVLDARALCLAREPQSLARNVPDIATDTDETDCGARRLAAIQPASGRYPNRSDPSLPRPASRSPSRSVRFSYAPGGFSYAPRARRPRAGAGPSNRLRAVFDLWVPAVVHPCTTRSLGLPEWESNVASAVIVHALGRAI